MMQDTALQLAKHIRDGIFLAHTASKPLDIVQYGVTMLVKVTQLNGQQKKALLIAAIELLAKGPDGVPGTPDDVILISPAVVAGLKALVESELLSDLVDMACSAVKWKAAWWRKRCARLSCVSGGRR